MLRRTITSVILLTSILTTPLLAGEAVELRELEDRAGLRLALSEELGASWRDVEVRRLAVRSSAGQRSLLASLPASASHVDIELDEGCSLIVAHLRKDGGARSSKLVACRAAGDPRAELLARLAAADGLTAKVGGRIEIRALVNPALVRPGSALAVRLYFENAPQANASLVARGPEGLRLTATTDASGIAHVTIPRGGRWVLAYRTERHAAELELDVPDAGFWDSLPSIDTLRPATALGGRVKATGEWQELGPAPVDDFIGDTGRAAAVAVSASRPNRYYVGGASGGLWESTDGGASWTSLNAGLPVLSIGAVAVDPKNDKVIYAGSGEGNHAYHSLYGLGLYRSFNRGRTWKVLAPKVFAGRAFSRLVVSPHDNRVVWAAVTRAGGIFDNAYGAREHPDAEGRMGVFRSRDRGQTWQRLRAPQGLPGIMASDVDLDPRDRNRVYVSYGDPFARTLNGIYRSDDGGESFERVLNEVPGDVIGRITLDVAPSDPDRLYALLTSPSSRENPGAFFPPGSSLLGIYRSDDGGDTWTLLPSPDPSIQGGQGSYNSALVVHPDDPDTFFVGGIVLYRSRDGGATYRDVTPLHVDLHDMTFDAAGRLVVANDGGVNRSGDLGETWITRNEGLGLIQAYPGLSFDPANPVTLLAGLQDNGTILQVAPGSWVTVFGGDGGHTAINPDQPNILFVEFQGTDNLFRSTNGGLSFQSASTGIDPGDRNCFLPPIVYDPGDSNRLLFATHRIYESTDGGQSWRAMSGDLTGGAPFAVRALVIAPSSSNVVYAMTNDGRVLVSSNAGADWELVLEGVGGWPRVTRQIAVDPRRASQAYVAGMSFGERRVMATLDRGRTWNEIGAGLPTAPVNTVAVHRAGSRRFVFAGTDRGVFVTRDLGALWEPLGNLPAAPVMDLQVDATNGRLLASTLGRGLWSIGLPEE